MGKARSSKKMGAPGWETTIKMSELRATGLNQGKPEQNRIDKTPPHHVS
jgi:hypothetical protein